jgi:hypothetical protein
MNIENIEDFKEWLEDLDIQTLTQELKDEILTSVEILVLNSGEDRFNEGLEEGIETAKEAIKNFLEDNL